MSLHQRSLDRLGFFPYNISIALLSYGGVTVESMMDLIFDGIRILNAIYNIRQQLRENQKSCRRLCVRVEIFRTFLEERKDQLDTFRPPHFPPVNLSSLQLSLKQLVDLLQEIHDYVVKYRQGGSFRCMIVNATFRYSQAQDFTSFNQRINDCATTLLPSLMINVEQQRHEELEDFGAGMAALAETLME